MEITSEFKACSGLRIAHSPAILLRRLAHLSACAYVTLRKRGRHPSVRTYMARRSVEILIALSAFCSYARHIPSKIEQPLSLCHVCKSFLPDGLSLKPPLTLFINLRRNLIVTIPPHRPQHTLVIVMLQQRRTAVSEALQPRFSYFALIVVLLNQRFTC